MSNEKNQSALSSLAIFILVVLAAVAVVVSFHTSLTAGLAALVGVLMGAIVLLVAGYFVIWLDWAGVRDRRNIPYKTLWDWSDLLIVPLILLIGATWFSVRQDDAKHAEEVKQAQATQTA